MDAWWALREGALLLQLLPLSKQGEFATPEETQSCPQDSDGEPEEW